MTLDEYRRIARDAARISQDAEAMRRAAFTETYRIGRRLKYTHPIYAKTVTGEIVTAGFDADGDDQVCAKADGDGWSYALGDIEDVEFDPPDTLLVDPSDLVEVDPETSNPELL